MSAVDYSGPERRRRAGGDTIRILIVDDHVLFRVGISNILAREPDLDVVGEADDSRSAVDAALESSPDVILMDISLPSPGGIETTARIKRELPSTAVIVLASAEDEDELFDAIKAGAAAFILKDVGPDDLVQLFLDVLQCCAQIVAIELLLPALPELIEHVLDARHPLALRVLDPPLEHAPERVPEIAVRHEVVGHGRQEVVGVEVGELLGAVPTRVAKEHRGLIIGPAVVVC